MDLWWDEADAEHITTRSLRYPGAQDIDAAWTLQAAADPARVVRDPDPRSRAGFVRLIGYSGVTAWKTRGADLRAYLEEGPRR